MQRMPRRASWWMTAASFAWVWGLLSVAWPQQELLCLGMALVFGVATWVTTQWPWPGVVLTAAALVALGLMGIGTEDPAPLGPLFIVLVTVGYLAPPPWSVLAVPVLMAATAIPGRWEVVDVVFGTALLVLPWWFGSRVRLRDARRKHAAAHALRLAGLDPAVQARLAAASERAEVAASAFEVIGRAVGQMTKSAAAARHSLDAATIRAIHRKGEEATQRLRALLVLLRDAGPEPVPGAGQPEDEGADPTPPEGGGARGAGWLAPVDPAQTQTWRQTLLRGWPGLLILADVFGTPVLMSIAQGSPSPDLPTPTFVLLVVLPLIVVVVLRDRLPAVMPWVAAAVLVLGTLIVPEDMGRDGVWLMVAVIALAWSAGVAGTRLSLVAWLVFTNTVGLLVFLDTPYYLPIYLALSALPFGAGAVWSGHHAAEAAHLERAQVRQQEIQTAEQAARARERLHLARDLHDAASHAVGTMMMQANAAGVLRERDPEGARAALDAIVDIGREAGAELRAMHSSASEPESEHPHEDIAPRTGAPDLQAAIAPLVNAARRTGSTVRSSLDVRTTPSRADVTLLLRVVREGLANAARHAPGSEVDVEVSVLPSRVLVVVTNGPARPDAGQDGTVHTSMGLGLGLRGLRELITERRGELSAEATDFGYELRAMFPPHRVAQRMAEPVVPT